MTEKSPERMELESEATKLGVDFKHNISDDKLLERVAAAQDAPNEDENKLSPLEGLHNKLKAYGIPDDQLKGTVEDCEAQLARVLSARAKASEKRQQKDQGDYYGKVATVRITKLGDGKVGTGEYIAGIGNLCYEAGETAEIPLKSAEALEAKGWVEIV